MKHSLAFTIPITICLFISLKLCQAVDSENLQDTCPTDTSHPIFINGYPCKNPKNIIASDFKTMLLSHEGDTDNFYGSSVNIVTAAEFPGLNTLGLSVSRIDFDDHGLVLPHTHPRASEMVFVSKGVVTAGFVDTENQVFQKVLNEGDVFVFPRGLLHFFLNDGFEPATVFSVLNSQNPGVVSISGAMFGPNDSEAVTSLVKKLVNLKKLGVDYRLDNVTFFNL